MVTDDLAGFADIAHLPMHVLARHSGVAGTAQVMWCGALSTALGVIRRVQQHGSDARLVMADAGVARFLAEQLADGHTTWDAYEGKGACAPKKSGQPPCQQAGSD